MVRQGRNRAWMKVRQQRNGYATIHVDSPKCHRPSGGITCADSDFIALAYARSGKENVEPFYVYSQLCIGKGVAIIVTQGFLGPLFTDGLFEIFQIVPHISLYLF